MTHLFSIVLSFILYSLFLLLPLVPAILVYKLFPDTKVMLKGPLSNFTFNATGAFAGYVLVMFIGYPTVRDIRDHIKDTERPTWTLNIPIELRDENDQILDNPGPEFLANMTIILEPKIKAVSGNRVKLKLPGFSCERDNYEIYDSKTFKKSSGENTTIDNSSKLLFQRRVKSCIE